MLANRLKYATTDKKQSLADQVYGSMILATAINSAYKKVEKISFANAYYRKDIGQRALKALTEEK